MTLMPSSAGSRADRVAYFIERFCKLSDGEFYGQPLTLRAWQRELINGIYAEDENGRLKHRISYIGLPRKNGKSTLAAALAVHALVAGPHGAEVYSAAGDRTQARIVFREARDMVLASPDLRSRVTVFQHSLETPHNGGVYRALSADAKLQQGLNPSFVVFDEVHVQPNRHLWDALQLGMGTRPEGQMLGITTAGFDRQSLAWELYDHGKRILSGEADDERFYFRWWEPADSSADWRDPAVWEETNPAFGDFLLPEGFESDIRSGIPESEYRRYRLNQWTTTRDAWLPHGAWDACYDPRVVKAGEEVVLGFDGAWTEDSTAIIGCTPDGHLFLVKVWEKPAGEPAWQTPTHEVDEAMREAVETYKVREIACDPHQWREQLARWAEWGWPVVEWPTNAVARMVPACSEFYRAVMEKRLTHDGNPTLARHIANAVIKEDRFGRRIVKDRASQKIDAAVAAVIAYDRARNAPVKKQSRYNDPNTRLTVV
jgi:phage terminase large subunit-like protein